MPRIARSIPQDELDTIKALRRDGFSYKEIGRKTRRSSETVAYWCQTAGLGGVRRAEVVPLRPDLQEAVADLFKIGMSIRAIAEQIGVNRDHVQKITASLRAPREKRTPGPPAGRPRLDMDEKDTARFNGSIFVCSTASPAFIAEMRARYADRLVLSSPVHAILHGVKLPGVELAAMVAR